MTTYIKTILDKSMPIVMMVALVLAGVACMPSLGKAQTSQVISQQLSIGARGTDVTRLQNFLTVNNLVYPQGLVTGYFGPLTLAAVKQFQLAYDISPTGKVGPITLAKINSMIVAGKSIDIASPMLSPVSVSVYSQNSRALSWTTGESAMSKVFYDTKPLTIYEADHSFMEPSVSGQVVVQTSFTTSQYVVLTGLSQNTVYYYTAESIDSAGNVSILPQSSFIVQ